MKGKNKFSPAPDQPLSTESPDKTTRLGNEAPKIVLRERNFAPTLTEQTQIAFDPKAPQLTNTWSSNARFIYCINTYPNGISLSIHENKKEGASVDGEVAEPTSVPFLPNQFHLRLKETRDYQLPQGKYYLYRENYEQALEQHLSALRKHDLLDQTVVYFGTTNDPFLGLHKKFDITVGCLDLLEMYRPALTVVQSRSPMLIAGLPHLKLFGDRAVVAMPIETHLEQVIAKFTPGMPKIGERLVAADGLRRQGVRVNLVASPILPYGEFYKDAWDFAELLDRHADYVTFGALASEDGLDAAQLRTLAISRKLVTDNHLRWLRPHCYKYVYYALSVIAPDKLVLPVPSEHKPNQLDLFAAA